jgi:hypothetical protein
MLGVFVLSIAKTGIYSFTLGSRLLLRSFTLLRANGMFVASWTF